MVWVRIADDFTDHPKVVEAGPLASWLYVCGLTYANRYLTDGFIPNGQVRRMADVEDAYGLAARLVAVGLWERAEGGFKIHDYHGYQPSSEDVKKEREETARRQAEYRRRKTEQRSNGVSNAVTNGERLGAPYPYPVPARNPVPDPSITTPQPPPLAEGEYPPTPRKRGAAKGRRGDEGAVPSERTDHQPDAAGSAPGESLAPPTEADAALWADARGRVSQFMNAVNWETYIAPLAPLGRAADGGMHLRAPPGRGAQMQRFRQTIARSLFEAGDPEPERVVIVEARPGQE